MVSYQHLLIFGHEGDIHITKKEMKDFLVELSELLNLNILLGPLVTDGTVKPGMTGVLVIEESHITVHTFTDHPNEFWLDILSCKPFDQQEVIDFFTDRFNFKKISIKHK